METYFEVEDVLAHNGVKGMKWGQRKDRFVAKRRENSAARKKTRKAVGEIANKPLSIKESDIFNARKASTIDAATNKYVEAHKKYKRDKKRMNKIDARRPRDIASAELDRIQRQGEVLTPTEQKAYYTLRAGRLAADAIWNTNTSTLASRNTDRNLAKATSIGKY